MAVSATKNRQAPETLERMVKKCFGEETGILTLRDLEDGFCNMAYALTLSNGLSVICKISPKEKSRLLRVEVELMEAETRAMQLVRKQTNLPVAEVYAYDRSCQVCSSPYFFMQALTGNGLHKEKAALPPAVLEGIYWEVGQMERQICTICHDTFGFVGDTRQFADWFSAFSTMMADLLQDALEKSIDLTVPYEDILHLLAQEKALFDEVDTPRLVHWDLWDGNIFVRDGHVSGLIDWERALWGDPLMDDRFRRHERNEAFLAGFGKQQLSPGEYRRILWYDVFLYAVMMTEGAYRGYTDDSQYQAVRPLFGASFRELQGEK